MSDDLHSGRQPRMGGLEVHEIQVRHGVISSGRFAALVRAHEAKEAPVTDGADASDAELDEEALADWERDLLAETEAGFPRADGPPERILGLLGRTPDGVTQTVPAYLDTWTPDPRTGRWALYRIFLDARCLEIVHMFGHPARPLLSHVDGCHCREVDWVKK